MPNDPTQFDKEDSLEDKKFLEKEEISSLKEGVVAALHGIYDPEIPVDIYNLGLIYDVIIDDDNNVKIIMTLTSPNCPVAETLPHSVEEAARNVDGVRTAKVELVWDPEWTKDMMSDAARLELGMF